MCTYSMVYDHYYPKIPTIWPLRKEQQDQLEQVIKDFKDARDAAKVADNLTGQKDCTDSVVKEKLAARVAELEKRLEKLEKKPKKKSKKKAK